MTILFGHPGGNPNAHQAALAHYEAGRLAAMCVPWMPTRLELRALRAIPRIGAEVARLERRSFDRLLQAPRVEGRIGEWWRMSRRLMFRGRYADEGLSYEANDWLMRTMARECRRPSVSAVHAYEDCSLLQFAAAKRLGKPCIYDLPIGYYPAWEGREAALAAAYPDWVPAGGLPGSRHVRPGQKRQEMQLADVVLVPSSYVASTVATHIDKRVSICPYGVDSEFWHPLELREHAGSMVRFLYAGACSLRKGIPLLLQAWNIAALEDARLELVGMWNLAEHKRRQLPRGVTWTGPLGRDALRERYQQSDVFVFPSYFEGFGLVILEAMACGLPAIATDASAGPDVLDHETGCVVPVGDVEALAHALRWFSEHRRELPRMRAAARARSAHFTWSHYRERVTAAVAPYVGEAA